MSKLMCAALLLLASCASPVVAQGEKQPFFDTLPAKLRAVKYLSNHDRGLGGRNDFYLLSKELLSRGTVKEFKAMARDRNPIVRAMGLLCLAQTNADENYVMLLLHAKDKAEVYLHEGCIVSKITVGEFVQRVMSNPHFLEPEGRRPAM